MVRSGWFHRLTRGEEVFRKKNYTDIGLLRQVPLQF